MFLGLFRQKSTPTSHELQDYRCDNLKLSVFIKCLLGDDPKSHGIGNWSELYAEYLDILGDPKAMQIIFLERDIQVIRTKIGLIELAASLPQSERTQAYLRKYGIQTPDRLKAVCKSLNIDAKNKEAQLEREAAAGNKSKMTASDFENNLVVLGKFNNGLNTDPEQITVARYCAMVKTLQEENGRNRGN